VLELGWEPVLKVLIAPWLFKEQIMVVLGLLILCLIYPMWRVYRLDLVSALKGGAHAD